MDGVVVVDKPRGMTSHDVVAKVRRVAGQRKVGHAGTLDPMATGVLVVCLGRATRLVPYLQAGTKTYDARMRLGVTTDSLDADGRVTAETDASEVNEDALCEALKRYVGEIEQLPPMVSAVKVGGERLYAKARRGEQVERQPRKVTIHDLVLSDFQPGTYPEAAFLVTCSAGTYVRALAADVGEELQVGAHLTSLRRLSSGRFTTEQAMTLDALEQAAAADDLDAALISPAAAVADYPTVRLDSTAATALGHGRALPPTGYDGPVAALTTDGRLLAMVEDRDGAAKPLAVFPSQ